MSGLTLLMEEYVHLRRALGVKFWKEEGALRRYVEFVEACESEFLRPEIFHEWRRGISELKTSTVRTYIAAIRPFTVWANARDPRHVLPANWMVPRNPNRPRPHIFTDVELERLLEASRRMTSLNGMARKTYPVLWSLLYVTGMRISEALALRVDSIDFKKGIVLVPAGKGGYDRILPLDGTTLNEIRRFVRDRNTALNSHPPWLFTGETGERLHSQQARWHFARVCRSCGIRGGDERVRIGKGPRIHDLRHTFAVRTLINVYKQGLTPDQELLSLVNFMGHRKLEDTYWYLEAAPELMELASKRFQNYIKKKIKL
jgi:integrase